MAKKKEQKKEIVIEAPAEMVKLKKGDYIIILNSTGKQHTVSSQLAETLLKKGAAILK